MMGEEKSDKFFKFTKVNQIMQDSFLTNGSSSVNNVDDLYFSGNDLDGLSSPENEIY